MARQTVLGIDPGLQISGYAALTFGPQGPRVLEAGIIRTSDSSPVPEMAPRLTILYDGIVDVLNQYQPIAVAMEQLYAHYNHPRTAIQMGHARGVLMLAAGQKNIPVFHYNATRIKKTITGSGRAPKEQVQRAIQKELSLQALPEPSDVADALAVALCHYYAMKQPE